MNTPLPPLVSIIIPCYRQGRYLAETVRALLDQTHPRIEIIVVNDGSDDNTDEVAKGFGERIVYLPKRNGGHSSARNAGIERATGDYIYFLDADDLIHPESIAGLVEAAEAGGGCIAMMGYRTFEQLGDWQGGEDAPSADSLFPWLLVRNYPVHCYLIPRRAALAAGKWDSTMASHEDHDFFLRVAVESPVLRTVPLRGAYYRQHPGSESRNRLRMARGKLQYLSKATALLAARPELASAHGERFLRHLYVSRLLFAAQAPELDRAELDHCIATMHRIGVRTKFDWGYALVPGPLRRTVDAVIVSMFRLVGSKKLDGGDLAASTVRENK